MANRSPYGGNSFGVKALEIDFDQPGTPTTQVYHGGTIVVEGNIIGRINAWQAAGSMTREGTHIYEVSKETWGLPVDYVPGRATGFNITWTRTEVWNQELERALGYPAVWKDLTDQNRPFRADEMLFKGVVPYRTWSYSGCWFTEKTPSEWSSEGDGVFSVSCNMAYVSRQKTADGSGA